MWFINVNVITTMNIISNLVSHFYEGDYSKNFSIKSNINVLESKEAAKSFEFSPEAMKAAQSITKDQFSDKFLFGAGSSAYQIEGAYRSPEKGESVWDYWTHHNPGLVKDMSNGDIACNSFYKYDDDVRLLKYLGANSYRISLSWVRMLPSGLANQVSLEGVKYYNELIDAMLLNGITPIVTIHHYDIPQRLQVLGGWTNPKMVEWFQDFARAAFTYFGDRVKHWITINDPYELCNSQFGNTFKPYYSDDGIGNYLCGHHVLLSHSKVYHMYRDEFQPAQKGKVGISVGTRWFEPSDPDSLDDATATEMSFQFANCWFLNPLLGEEGNYPSAMQIEINVKSVLQGFAESRLPAFTQEEVDLIRGSVDFIGINFFTTYKVRSYESLNDTVDAFIEKDMFARWLPNGAFDIKDTAENFGKLLKRLNDDYILPQVYITANGYADSGEIHDVGRANYHYNHINELLKAIKSGVDVRAYIAWSLLDSFEWKDGYRKHFGLYGVDFTDVNRPRKSKFSTKVLKYIYETKKLPKQIKDDWKDENINEALYRS